MKSAWALVAVSLGVAGKARAEDLKTQVYSDMKWVVEQVITKELAEEAFPSFLTEYPHPLAYFPRVSQRLHQRNLNDLGETVRADLGDDIVLAVYLEEYRRGLSKEGKKEKPSLASLFADQELAKEVICQRTTDLGLEVDAVVATTQGVVAATQDVVATTQDIVATTQDIVDKALGRVREAASKRVICKKTGTYFEPVQSFLACLQGTPVDAVKERCRVALALSAYARRDHDEFFEQLANVLEHRIQPPPGQPTSEAPAGQPSPEARAAGRKHLQDLLASIHSRQPLSGAALLDALTGIEQALPQAGREQGRRALDALVASSRVDGFVNGAGSTGARRALREVVATTELSKPLQDMVQTVFTSQNSTRYRELYHASALVLRQNIPSICGEGKSCRAGLTFVDRLGAYTIAATADQAGQETARQAFRDSAVDFIDEVGANNGIDRTISNWFVKPLIPRLELAYTVSPSYLNRDGSSGGRFGASITTLGWYWRCIYTDSAYWGLQFTMLDLAAPFAEFTHRPQGKFANDGHAFLLFIRPQVGAQFGLPWLSKHLLLTANTSYRLVSAEATPDLGDHSYRYLNVGQAGAYRGFEFGLGLRFLP